MAFIPVPDTCEITFLFTVSSLSFTNNLFYFKSGGFSDAAVSALAQAAAEEWRDNVLPNQCNIISLIGADGRDISQQNGYFSNYRFGSVPVGGITTPPASLNNAMCITHRTTTSGRSFRGRTYVSGLPEVSADIDSWDVSFVNTVVADFLAMQTAIASGEGVVPVVVSRYTNGAPRSSGVTTNIASYDANPLVATQRRRIPR